MVGRRMQGEGGVVLRAATTIEAASIAAATATIQSALASQRLLIGRTLVDSARRYCALSCRRNESSHAPTIRSSSRSGRPMRVWTNAHPGRRRRRSSRSGRLSDGRIVVGWRAAHQSIISRRKRMSAPVRSSPLPFLSARADSSNSRALSLICRSAGARWPSPRWPPQYLSLSTFSSSSSLTHFSRWKSSPTAILVMATREDVDPRNAAGLFS
uniref:Uncharacterized protein n=1 Tax=Plectus sambesii TaxID=2011161 RepID=A0A914VRA4_9BILA